MAKHHMIISGTGRAGTTFLVQLFTALGLDTGFTDLTSDMFENCDAGMEKDIHLPDAPYIVKTPWLCDYLDEVLEDQDRVIDHAIVPMRDLYSAAQSRREVASKTDGSLYAAGIPGGLWHTDTPEHQEAALTHQLYKLIYTLAKRDIPLTLLHFPRLIHDPEYLFRKIGFALQGIENHRLMQVFEQVARPELVHTFNPQPIAKTVSSEPESSRDKQSQ
jgi:hypothetical protein